MIVFTLSVLFCVTSVDCRWYPIEQHVSELECKHSGAILLTGDPQILIYRCSVAVREVRQRQ